MISGLFVVFIHILFKFAYRYLPNGLSGMLFRKVFQFLFIRLGLELLGQNVKKTKERI